MFRNPQISGKNLFPFCRSMSRMLSAGVEIRKALKTASASTRDSRLTESVKDVGKHVKKGDDLTHAFKAQGRHFPPLFLDLLNVGELTGTIPEIFDALADYYEANTKRLQEFRSQIAWPVIQLIAAIFIIGFLIFILGIIGDMNPGSDPVDILGLGLMGTSGAIKWFTMCFGTAFMIWGGYIVATRSASGRQALHPFLMTIPGVGYCMRSFAIARFSWCFALTQQSGMSIKPSLTASLKATGNGAFIASTDNIWMQMKEGETLSEALSSTRLFPVEFMHMVETAEHSGTVPETLDRMSHSFDEDAHRAMTRLTSIMAQLIWGLVACFIGFIVIKFFMTYVAMLEVN